MTKSVGLPGEGRPSADSPVLLCGDHRQLARGIRVHEMRDHVEGAAVDPLLARVVEVELCQLVFLAANLEPAALIDVHLDTVAVVDDVPQDQVDEVGLVGDRA